MNNISSTYTFHLTKEMDSMPKEELVVTVISTVLATTAHEPASASGPSGSRQSQAQRSLTTEREPDSQQHQMALALHGDRETREREEQARERARVAQLQLGEAQERERQRVRMERARAAWERAELVEHMHLDHGMDIATINEILGPLPVIPMQLPSQSQSQSCHANGILTCNCEFPCNHGQSQNRAPPHPQGRLMPEGLPWAEPLLAQPRGMRVRPMGIPAPTQARAPQQQGNGQIPIWQQLQQNVGMNMTPTWPPVPQQQQQRAAQGQAQGNGHGHSMQGQGQQQQQQQRGQTVPVPLSCLPPTQYGHYQQQQQQRVLAAQRARNPFYNPVWTPQPAGQVWRCGIPPNGNGLARQQQLPIAMISQGQTMYVQVPAVIVAQVAMSRHEQGQGHGHGQARVSGPQLQSRAQVYEVLDEPEPATPPPSPTGSHIAEADAAEAEAKAEAEKNDQESKVKKD